MDQEKFNQKLKSKGYKIISIDCFTNYFTYYIRKIEKEKITSKDYLDLCDIKGYLVTNVKLKDSDYYIKFRLN